MRVVRVYHAGRSPAARARDRALATAGHQVALVVPDHWTPAEDGAVSTPEDAAAGLEVLPVPVRRAGDVNRHRYVDPGALSDVLRRVRPDVVDLHEEPFSVAVHQWLGVVPARVPVVAYTAQNLDKRWPPPFGRWERRALSRVAGFYPCSRQAASVLRGKGYAGLLRVLPLGLDTTTFHASGRDGRAGRAPELLLAGRLVPEKGVLDAVEVLAATRELGTRLVLVGAGPAAGPALDRAAALGLGDRVDHLAWLAPAELADRLRRAAAVLVPSRATATWVEQFGRAVTEAQACGAPVVAYASGSLAEVVGEAGLVVPEGDVVALAEAVRGVLTDRGLADTLRTRGLAAAASRTWDRVAAEHAALYEAAVASPLPPAPRPASAATRAAADAELGPPACAANGVARPFADPVMRRLGARQEPVGRLLDRLSRRG